jgi:hypothetical protein
MLVGRIVVNDSIFFHKFELWFLTHLIINIIWFDLWFKHVAVLKFLDEFIIYLNFTRLEVLSDLCQKNSKI